MTVKTFLEVAISGNRLSDIARHRKTLRGLEGSGAKDLAVRHLNNASKLLKKWVNDQHNHDLDHQINEHLLNVEHHIPRALEEHRRKKYKLESVMRQTDAEGIIQHLKRTYKRLTTESSHKQIGERALNDARKLLRKENRFSSMIPKVEEHIGKAQHHLPYAEEIHRRAINKQGD